MHDVFISFSFEDQKTAEEIVNKLQSKYGISCWICTHDIRAGDNYKEAIVNAITDSKAFILLQTVNSMKSKEVPKEIGLAMTREKVIIPFTMDDSALSPELEYDLNAVQRIDARTPTLDDRIGELAAGIRNVIGYPKANVENDNEDNTDLKLKSSKISCNSGFMGRDNEIQELHENLRSNDIVFLHGIGGIGKSEIAKQYAKRYSGEYDEIIFAAYTSTLREMIVGDNDIAITNFSKAANETEDEYFVRKLARIKELATEKTLIIVDNFDTDYDDDLEDFAEGSYKLLFTTRSDYSDTGYPVIRIKELDAQEQYELFIKIYNRPLRGDDEDKIREILELINGHTLTIELAAKMTQMKRQPARILEEMKSSGISSVLGGTVKHGLKSDVAYMYIHRLFSMSKLSDDEMNIMMNMAFIPVDGADFVEFGDLCDVDDYGIIDGLIKKSWIIYDNEADKVRLHPLIREIIIKEYNPDIHTCSIMYSNICEKCREKRNKMYELHDETANLYIGILNSFFADEKNICIHYEEGLLSLCIYLEEYDLAHKLLNKWLQAQDLNEQETAYLYYLVSDIYQYERKYGKSFEYISRAIEIYKKYSDKTLDYAYYVKYLFLIDIKYSRYKSKEELENLLKICEDILLNENSVAWDSRLASDPKRNYASLQYCYGLLYLTFNEYERAVSYSEKSQKLFSELDNGFIWMMSPLTIEAVAYSKSGNSQEALRLINQAIEISKKQYHHNHYKVIERYKHLEEIYRNLCMYKEEMELLVYLKSLLEEKNEHDTALYRDFEEKIAQCKLLIEEGAGDI